MVRFYGTLHFLRALTIDCTQVDGLEMRKTNLKAVRQNLGMTGDRHSNLIQFIKPFFITEFSQLKSSIAVLYFCPIDPNRLAGFHDRPYLALTGLLGAFLEHHPKPIIMPNDSC